MSPATEHTAIWPENFACLYNIVTSAIASLQDFAGSVPATGGLLPPPAPLASSPLPLLCGLGVLLGVIFCFDSLKDPAAAIKKVKDLGKFVAISLLVTEPLSVLEPHWKSIDQVTIVGTPMATKGHVDAAVDLRQDPRGPCGH